MYTSYLGLLTSDQPHVIIITSHCHPFNRPVNKHLLSDTWATDNSDDELPPRCCDVNMQLVPTCSSSQLSYDCVSAENNDSFFISCDLMTLEAVSRVWREWEQDRDIISIQRGILITSLRDNVWQPQCSEKTQFCKYHQYHIVLCTVSHYSFCSETLCVNDCRENKSCL